MATCRLATAPRSTKRKTSTAGLPTARPPRCDTLSRKTIFIRREIYGTDSKRGILRGESTGWARQVPEGMVATYGQIARRVASPAAHATSPTPWPVNPRPGIIPCHRIVFADGRLAPGFAFGGPEAQRELLEAEGVSFLQTAAWTCPPTAGPQGLSRRIWGSNDCKTSAISKTSAWLSVRSRRATTWRSHASSGTTSRYAGRPTGHGVFRSRTRQPKQVLLGLAASRLLYRRTGWNRGGRRGRVTGRRRDGHGGAAEALRGARSAATRHRDRAHPRGRRRLWRAAPVFSTLYLETHHDLMAAIALYRALDYAEDDRPLPGSPHTTMDVFFKKEL